MVVFYPGIRKYHGPYIDSRRLAAAAEIPIPTLADIGGCKPMVVKT
jgi:hypothetical protein